MTPFAAMKLRAASSLPTPEPTWANVSLLIHGDARPFIDSGPNTLPVANWGARCTLTNSAVTTPNSSSVLLIPPNSAFSFGTGAWMVAGYIFWPTSSVGRVFDSRSNTSATDGCAFTISTGGKPTIKVGSVSYGVGGGGLPDSAITVTASTRTHVAISYDGTTLRAFVGGALSWSHAVSLSSIAVGTAPVAILNSTDATHTDGVANTRLDELIVVKGEAVYTSAFAPPTRYTDTGTVIAVGDTPTYSNVKLNIHGSSLANNSTAITDVSTSARTVSVLGNAKATTSQFRIGTSSIDFDGTGDYLTVPSSSDWAFGTGDYCVELQQRATSTTGIRTLIATANNSTTGFGLQNNISVAGDVNWNETGDGVDIASGGIGVATINTWGHVAVGRLNTWLMMFYEGELINITIDSQSVANAIALYIGRLTTQLTTRDWTGQMQEIRVCNGEMPYKKSFIVQTAAHPDS